MSRVVIRDESWIFEYDPESSKPSQQCRNRCEVANESEDAQVATEGNVDSFFDMYRIIRRE